MVCLVAVALPDAAGPDLHAASADPHAAGADSATDRPRCARRARMRHSRSNRRAFSSVDRLRTFTPTGRDVSRSRAL